MFGNPKSSTERAAASRSAAAPKRGRRTEPRRNATLRHWAPAIVTVLAVVVGQLFGSQDPALTAATSAEVRVATDVPAHLRTVALDVPGREQPDLSVGSFVDVHGTDPSTGATSLLVAGATVAGLDEMRLIVAVDERDASRLAAAMGLGRIVVFGR